MKKVALVVPSFEFGGGVPTIAKNFYNFLINKYEVDIFSLSVSSNCDLSTSILNPLSWFKSPKIIQYQTIDNIKYYKVGTRFREIEFMRYQPKKIFDDILAQYDFIQIVSGVPAWGNVARNFLDKTYIQCATMISEERKCLDFKFHNYSKQINKYFINFIDNSIIKNTSCMFVENSWMFESCKKLNNNTFFIMPGIDTDFFQPINNSISDYILFVGRLSDDRKNINFLIESYELLRQENLTNKKLIIAGIGDMKSDIISKIKCSKYRNDIEVIKNASFNKILNLYQNAFCFHLPSYEEGLGMVLLESMSCGTIPISSKSGGPNSLIEHGKNGYLYTTNDFNEFRKYFLKLLDTSNFNTLRTNLIDSYRFKYSMDSCFSEMVSKYK